MNDGQKEKMHALTFEAVVNDGAASCDEVRGA